MYLSVFGLGCLVCCSVGNNGFHSRCQVAKWQSRRNRGTGGYLPLPLEFGRNRIKKFSFKIPWITPSPTPRIFRPSYGSGWYLVCSSFRFSFEMNEIGILPGREKKNTEATFVGSCYAWGHLLWRNKASKFFWNSEYVSESYDIFSRAILQCRPFFVCLFCAHFCHNLSQFGS